MIKFKRSLLTHIAQFLFHCLWLPVSLTWARANFNAQLERPLKRFKLLDEKVPSGVLNLDQSAL